MHRQSLFQQLWVFEHAPDSRREQHTVIIAGVLWSPHQAGELIVGGCVPDYVKLVPESDEIFSGGCAETVDGVVPLFTGEFSQRMGEHEFVLGEDHFAKNIPTVHQEGERHILIHYFSSP